MDAIPRGTVSFLFTDVVGSTRLWEHNPDAMGVALAEHDRLLRALIEANDGYVFSTAGDAFSAAFWSPADAVRAAVEGQRQLAARTLAAAGVRVRMGVHTGTADERDGDYFGPAVNRAARIMSAGHGGQILVSLATEELLRDRPPGGVSFLDLGEHELAGLGRRERVFQVMAPDLPTDLPPLRAAGAAPGNLPDPLTSFVGRDGELAKLVALTMAHRLICVTGTGGMGKTRGALAAGHRLADRFPDGVWLVELASVSHADAVDAAAMAALGEVPVPGLTAREVVLAALRKRHALLIVDNCEHVSDSAAGFVRAVLGHCPGLHVLATSRQPLGVAGEHAFPLPPLSGEDQVALFRERALAVRPGADLDGERIAYVCGRLDGMPLAIELAAARLRSMSLVELSGRLDERLRLLKGSPGDDPRHRTLQAVLDWSFSLLDPAEQRFFARLALFAGDFDLRAATMVAGDGDELAALDLLDSLVARSLVVATERDEHTVFRLLETLRHYGHAHIDPDDLGATARRHAEHYIQEVRQWLERLRAGDDQAAMAGISRCWDNLREAARIALDCQDTDLALRLLAPLATYVYVRPDPEVAAWTSAALALPGAASHRLALTAHLLLSQTAYPAMELARAEKHARQALTIIEQQGLKPLPRPYIALGYALGFQGRFPESLVAFRRGVDIARDQARNLDLVEALCTSILWQLFAGEKPLARDIEELAELRSATDNQRAVSAASAAIGLAALVEGRAEAVTLLREAADLAKNRLFTVEGVYRGWARIAEARGSPSAEMLGMAEYLSHYEETKISFAIRGNLQFFIPALDALQRHRAVALVAGAGMPLKIFHPETEHAISNARSVLGGETYEALVEQGRRMAADDIAAFVRSELDALGIPHGGQLGDHFCDQPSDGEEF